MADQRMLWRDGHQRDVHELILQKLRERHLGKHTMTDQEIMRWASQEATRRSQEAIRRWNDPATVARRRSRRGEAI